tara:strand:- start:29361 stop:30122 length:762 start_codon:yes stop_codon:yes gene_type:complete
MASKKFAYKNKGNQIAILEQSPSGGGGRLAVAHCTVGNHNNKADCEAAGGTWIPGSSSSIENYGKYVSPIEDIADGLEIEYTYVLNYKINRTDTKHTDLAKYRASSSGNLQLKGPDVRNYDTTMDAGNYIVLSNAGRFNGLHKIDSFANSGGTGDIIVLDTSYSGDNASWTDFEETVTMHYDVSAMIDESFELDVSHQQASAIVYFIKAKMMEDMGEMERREYFLREFRRAVEKAASDRKYGTYRSIGFGMTR